MSRSRYVITEADKPHFLTCTVMEWLPVFTHNNPVKRGYVDKPEYWRSSARNYMGEAGFIGVDGWA